MHIMSKSAPEILIDPNPILRRQSRKVKPKDNPGETAERMIEAALNWQLGRKHETAVALAAPQIGINQNIIIIKDRDNIDDRAYEVFFNVRIIKLYGSAMIDQEGCLSVKDIYAATPRYEKIKFVADDLDFNRVERKLTGFDARVMQHEVDHINGILFIDHKPEDEKFFVLGESGKLEPTEYETKG